MSTAAQSDVRPEPLICEDEITTRASSRNMESRPVDRLISLLLVAVVVVSVAALIVAVVSLARSGNVNVEFEEEIYPQGASKDKVWTFGTGHYDVNMEYLDEESGTIKGYHVDIINAVCKIANKNCEIVYDVSERCWMSDAGRRARGGEGLHGGWYDVCTGWGITYDRSRVFSFTKPYSKLPGVGVYVANSTTNFDWTNIQGRRIGFVNGFSSDEHCLARYAPDLIQGAKLSVANNQISYYSSLEELVAAVIDGSVDAAFCYAEPPMQQLKRLTDDTFPNRCALGGFGMMARKDRGDFITWWNDAFDKLINTVEYRLICEDLKKAHGHIPGRSPDEVCLS